MDETCPLCTGGAGGGRVVTLEEGDLALQRERAAGARARARVLGAPRDAVVRDDIPERCPKLHGERVAQHAAPLVVGDLRGRGVG